MRDVEPIQAGVFFPPTEKLPRGRHERTREQIHQAQRTRILIATTELLAARGLQFTIADVCQRASVSRSAFYEQFTSRDDALLAAHARFIDAIETELFDAVSPALSWAEVIERFLHAYVGMLRRDPVVARALLLEMSALGEPARAAIRASTSVLAVRIKNVHDALNTQPISVNTIRAGVLGVRHFLADALDTGDLDDDIVSELLDWIARAWTLKPDIAPTSEWSVGRSDAAALPAAVTCDEQKP